MHNSLFWEALRIVDKKKTFKHKSKAVRAVSLNGYNSG